MNRLIVVVSLALPMCGGAAAPGNAVNPQAVQEVRAGTRTEANAAWWGFDEEDSTEALQSAIRSGAKRVIVPNMKKDWVVRPITLAGNQELVFEDGVVVTAKRGEFREKGDSLLTAREISNVVIRGYGATVRMQKEDYMVGELLDRLGWNRWFGKYKKAESRMTLRLRGVTNVEVAGLTLRDSGGDGIYIDGRRDANEPVAKNIRIKDVVCDNHYRQGISIISVDGLVVENSVFKNTWGTPPAAGVDTEPDRADQPVHNVVFRNCRFEDNYGDGIEVHLPKMRTGAGEVSILFDGCHVSSRRGTGVRISKIRDEGPAGLIEFRNCIIENTEGFGIKIEDKSAVGVRLRFVNCVVRNVANNRKYAGPWAPIALRFPSTAAVTGGIDFVNCSVEDRYDRPVILVEGPQDGNTLADVTGKITVKNPHGVKMVSAKKQERVTLSVVESH